MYCVKNCNLELLKLKKKKTALHTYAQFLNGKLFNDYTELSVKNNQNDLPCNFAKFKFLEDT